MKIGFSKGRLTPALNLTVKSAPLSATSNSRKFDLERKFDVTDRVQGIWRQDEGGTRKVAADLFTVVLAAENSDGRFIVLSLDQTQIDFDKLDLIRSHLSEKTGLRKDRILCHSTHCHMTLNYDTTMFLTILEQTVNKALSSMTEAEVAAINIEVEGKRYVINRRVHLPGVGTRTIMFNDYCEIKDDSMVVTEQMKTWVKNLGGNPDDFIHGPISTDGEVDNNLQALIFRDAETKKTIGTLTRFASHPVIVSEKKANGDISADFPGYLREHIQEKLGGTAMFVQGPCGDLRPLMREYSHAFAKSYGTSLAEHIVKAANKAVFEKITSINFLVKPLNLPLRKDMCRTTEDAAVKMDELEKAFDAETNIEKRRRLQNLFWFYYRITSVKKFLRSEWLTTNTISTSMYALSFNKNVIIGNQGEIFLHTKKGMIAGFEKYNPITMTLCNEEMSYVPTLEDFDKGGYEPSVCLVEPGSTSLYVQTAQNLLKEIL
ncbi:MAG: hypothetical protein JNL74_17710 [Fibrobacteres bacterium]|nr:hypothetical protein [Fibrobacterota bacterium]